MPYDLTRIEWLTMKLVGCVHVQTRTENGHDVDYYAFRCNVNKAHGVQIAKPIGYGKKLCCPACEREERYSTKVAASTTND